MRRNKFVMCKDPCYIIISDHADHHVCWERARSSKSVDTRLLDLRAAGSSDVNLE